MSGYGIKCEAETLPLLNTTSSSQELPVTDMDLVGFLDMDDKSLSGQSHTTHHTHTHTTHTHTQHTQHTHTLTHSHTHTHTHTHCRVDWWYKRFGVELIIQWAVGWAGLTGPNDWYSEVRPKQWAHGQHDSWSQQ